MLAYTNVLYKIVFLVIKVSIVFSSSWPETDEMSRIKTRNYMWESGSYDTEVIKTYRGKTKMISSINKRYFAVVKDAGINGRIRWKKRWTKGEQTGRTERPMKSSPEAESSIQSSGYYLEQTQQKIPG
jgi:hypothetical protein